MSADQYLVTPDRPFIHRPITGDGALKAGTLVDADDVVDQVVTLAGASRARVYFKSEVAGTLAFKPLRPGGVVVGVYDTPLIAAVPIVAGTEAAIELSTTDFYGEATMLLEFTGDSGIVSPGAILYADICGVA